ncbi:acyltransferase family protein [Arthrobacter sp. NQ4]|uniref:acyltransferase family protein n=1 Tax=Arthrobacter sp. NQ4 TaxID=3027930 RepID=UPI0023B1F9CF|nr:acyltransferase family protein [Arthrobacter sp. NQ4]MDE8585914.1 acyltransferase family protein [Arthrobacter sp. NQ4]
MSLLLDRIPVLALPFNRKTGKGSRKTGLRPDIQGLRAFAVVAVILDHALGWPSGGFVGVDIFFVISGFVITASLLREHERTNRISWTDFYKRRVKRIMPAAVLVLLATSIAGFFVFNQVRAWNTVWDAVWAFFFGANWRQAVIGTDYFQATGPVSPLQHYWSLSVEEQFYFAWPLLMIVLFALTARLMRGQERVVAGTAMTLIVAGSFAWSVYETSTNPTVAYFSTFSRAWELGIGGVLACMATVLPRIPQAVRPVLAWVGMAGMVAALFLTDAHAGFPGPGAALAVLSAALFIAAGTGSSSHRYMTPLTNRAAVYLGDISYSLYLWHFPFVVIGASVVTEPTPQYFVVLVAGIFICSGYSYYLFEDPLRKSSWLTGSKRKHRDSKMGLPQNYGVVALSLLAIVTIVLVSSALAPQKLSPGQVTAVQEWNSKANSPAATSADKNAAPVTTYGPLVSQLQTELKQASTRSEWSNLTPSVDDVLRHNPEPDGVNQCGSQPADKAACVWGSATAPKRAVVVGDSIAIAWMPALIELYGKGEWSLTMEAKYGCPFTSRAAQYDSADCVAHKEATVRSLQTSPPDLLIVANNYPDSADAGVWSSELVGLIGKTSSGPKMVALAPPPHNTDMRKCYRPGSSPLDCSTTLGSWYGQLTVAERQQVESAGGVYVDTLPLFCVDGKTCPAFAGSTVMKIDDTHPSAYYVEKVTPALRELIAQGQASKPQKS